MLVAACTLALASTPALASRRIELVSGETITATILERSDTSLILSHRILGEIRVELSDIRTIDGREVEQPSALPRESFAAKREQAAAGPPAAPSSPAAVPGAPDAGAAAAEAVARVVEALPARPTWESRLEFGFSGSSGTTRDLRVRAGITSTRTAGLNTTRLDSLYRYGSSRGQRSENAATAGLLSEWKTPEPRWSTFVQSRADYDEFQSWDARLSASSGVTYRVFQLLGADPAEGKRRDIVTMFTRVGAGASYRFGLPSGEPLTPEGVLAVTLDWRINDRMSLDLESTWYPDLSEPDDFRTLSQAQWRWRVDQMRGIDLKLGLAHEYQTESRSTSARSDVSAFAALSIAF
ncbi:MAG: DUF481 domain-containing protein [Phycisphaeraceae bacterium]|nr:DUF481 domain-containing protein [Phycisphaeraceae bacterium]